MKFLDCCLLVCILLTTVTTITVLVIVLNESDNSNRDIDEQEELFQLSIIHINDFHARFEETNEQSLPCRDGEKCIGGLARMKTVVDQLMKKRPNAIYLNAGDNFQGTFWYNLLRYNVTSYFLNLIPADAMTLGNHEFTHRISGLIPFLKLIKSPMIVANIDDKNELTIQGLYKKSIVLERSGRKIGIIGVILRETNKIANVGKLKFTNEVEAIRKEATELRRSGVDIIIVLSHCGLDRDREIALESGDFVDIIVGGHSHSFLYTSKDGQTPGPDRAVGPYPIAITPKSGNDRKVLIVQASSFTKYVGDLKVYFNAKGHVKYYEGNPIFLSNDIKKHSDIERELIPWRYLVNQMGKRIIGRTNVDLLNGGCRDAECALGSFLTDAFVHEMRKENTDLQIYAGIIQSGGIRSSLPTGDITYGDIAALLPFGNTLDLIQLSGDIIKDVFEHSVSRSFVEDRFIGNYMLQISGFNVKFNVSKPVGQRLQSINIMSNSSHYDNINPYKYYTIIVPSFLSAGNDGFSMIPLYKRNHKIGLLDIDLIENFIGNNSPIQFETTGRIIVVT